VRLVPQVVTDGAIPRGAVHLPQVLLRGAMHAVAHNLRLYAVPAHRAGNRLVQVLRAEDARWLLAGEHPDLLGDLQPRRRVRRYEPARATAEDCYAKHYSSPIWISPVASLIQA
jgi:hypothetical protein